MDKSNIKHGDVLWKIDVDDAGGIELVKNYFKKDDPIQESKTIFLESGTKKAGLEHTGTDMEMSSGIKLT